MSEGFRRQAANVLARLLDTRLALPEKTVAIAANPSEVADYPRVAIQLERHRTVLHREDEIMVDDQGRPKVGALADLLAPAGAAVIAPGVHLSKIGSLRSSGKIWVGCRLAPQREQTEVRIARLFTEDTAAIGRLMLELKSPIVDDISLPWTWPVAAFADDTSWTAEHAFSERLWSWMDVDLEIDVLVPRRDPLMNTILLAIQAETGTPLPATVPDFASLEQITIINE